MNILLDQISDFFSFFLFSTLMREMKRRTKRRPSLLSSLTRINTKRQGNTISGGIFSPMSMVNLLSKLRKKAMLLLSNTGIRMLKMWSGALYKKTPAVVYARFYHIRNSLVASNNEMVGGGEGGNRVKERMISRRF